MKTKHLIWAALALPAIFAACSNEEFMTETNNPAVNSEVIEGIKFTVTKGGGVDTRLNANGWEDGDIVGLAYRGDGGTENVYANHALKYNAAGNFFASSSLIYVGEHFAYFPFDEEHLSIVPLTVSLATEQEVGKENDLIWKDGFSISAKDQLTTDNGSGYGQNAEFTLERMTNTLQLKVKAGNVGGITATDIKLKSVKIAVASGNKPFVQAVEVAPSKLPNANHDEFKALAPTATDAEIAAAKAKDIAATKESMALSSIYSESSKALNYTKTANIQTTIKGDVSINTEYGVNMLTFPTVDNAAAENITVTIVTNYGTVDIEKVDAAPSNESADAKAIRMANNAAIDKLVALLSEAGHTVGSKTYKLSEVNAAPLALSFTADMAQSTLTEIDITNDADVAEALKIATNVTGVTTFNIAGDASIDLAKVPANVVTIDVADTKTLEVSGEVKHDITFTTNSSGVVKVAADAALTINGTIPSPRKLTMSHLVNWGTVTIGGYGTLELSGTDNINHSSIINNGKLSLAASAALVNDKAIKSVGHPACEGELDNCNSIDGGASAYIVNKGTLHQRGTITTVVFKDDIGGAAVAVAGSIAISYNGAVLPDNCADTKQANVTTPEEMSKAISSGANTIMVDGVVSVSQNIAADADVSFVLQNQTQFYILTGTVATNEVNIKVTGDDVKLVTVDPTIYLSIEELEVAKDAKLTIGESSDAYANKTAINVAGLNYAGTVVNNGWVYAKAINGNSGSWSGMSVNKKETSAGDTKEIIISGDMSGR